MNKILRDEKVNLRYTVRLRYKMNINVIYNTYIIYYVPFFIINYFILVHPGDLCLLLLSVSIRLFRSGLPHLLWEQITNDIDP